jgi:uncharacterized membrane protein
MSNNAIIKAISAVIALGITGTSTSLYADNNGQAMMQASPVPGMERCFGIAKAGMNDCGNAKHHCSGEAKIEGNKSEWIYVPQGLCKRIVGGSTQSTPQS